jgi:hypothetical protein
MMGQIRAIIHNNEKKILIKIEKFSEFKNFAPHTNKKEIDFDLIKRYNTMEGIRNFFDNNVDYKRIDIFDNWFITNDSTDISEGKHFI